MSKFTLVPAAYITLRRDDKVLLIRRANTGYYDGFYSLPSGHIDGGEPAVLAAVREAKEEVGVDIAPEDLRFVHVMHRVAEEGNHERVDFFFEAIKWYGEPYNAEPHKCDDIQWFSQNALPDNLSAVVKTALEKSAAGEYYSHLNF